MKYLVQNRRNLLFATMMAASFGLNAQIESTHTDVKYGYTTVVYKDKAASDSDVLSALDNSIGMGDVVRVTIAPPKPVAVPMVDKSKGEDTWLKPATKPVLSTMTASTASNATINAPASAAANTSAAPAAAATKPASAALKANIAPVAVAKPSPAAPASVATKTATVPAPVVAPESNLSANSVAAAPTAVMTKSVASSSAYKSSNKSLKKGGKKGKSSFKMKHRKAGKQRYKCPKF